MGNEDSGILVRCACGKTLKAKMELAGQTAKCPACGAVLTVPTQPSEPSAMEVPTLPPATALVQTRPGTKDMRPVSRKVLFGILGAVALVVVVGVLLVVMKVFSPADPGKQPPVAASAPRMQGLNENITYEGHWHANIASTDDFPFGNITFIVENNTVTYLQWGRSTEIEVHITKAPVEDRKFQIVCLAIRSLDSALPLPVTMEFSGHFTSATTAAGDLKLSDGRHFITGTWTAKKS
jgi:hypothetical protein